MYTKIMEAAQAAALKVGAILKRYPSSGKPEELFDKDNDRYTDTYIITSINKNSKMIGLVMTGPSLQLFASPGDVGRLFIHPKDMAEQKIWWQ